jgi:pSer/pThr/pTyr-binding forkhead associated (FHA) protein
LGELYLEDCGSTGGTFVNNKRIGDREKVLLTDGMLIDLSRGPNSARLLVVLPPKKGFDSINTIEREKMEERIKDSAQNIAKKLDLEYLITDQQDEKSS